MDDFDIQGYTIPKVGKEKNGDSYIVEYLEEEKLLLAIVIHKAPAGAT